MGLIDSTISKWHGTSTLDDFKINGKKLPDQCACHRSLREVAVIGLQRNTSIENPPTEIDELLKQVKTHHTEVTLAPRHNGTFEDLLFDDTHKEVMSFIIEKFSNGIFALLLNSNKIVSEGKKTWGCHVFKVLSYLLTQHAGKMRAIYNTSKRSPSYQAIKVLYKSWATLIYFEKFTGTLTFKGFPLHHQDECTRFVDPFLQSLPLDSSQRTALRDLYDQNKMDEFVQQVIKMVTD